MKFRADHVIIVTIPDGELPLTPELTPGWGVAGMVMLVSGIVYTLVGIKNRWIHTFFSGAYATALGVAVLIVYVMNVPISNALQGGYIATVVLSGCAVGTACIFFKEMTEGLGCALGGFCVSMWMLCLVPGGLLETTAPKAIFTACFTAGGFAFYLSRYTRDWAFMILMSFAGATVTMLGIDCFSRAGYKEFWAYVWDINQNLFPLGAETYPITKGIRVETAGIVILCLIGIISQVKLWRIVRQQREKRAAQRAEGQRNLEQEEADVGREIEEANARDRLEWERVYRDGETGSSSATATGDAASEKKLVDDCSREEGVEAIEMTEKSDTERSSSGHEPLTEKDQDGKLTVRVAVDDFPEASKSDVEEEKEGGDDDDDEKPKLKGKKRHPERVVSASPEVVPLPFTVPEEEDSKSQTGRSSVATFADDEGKVEETRRRDSFANRLSVGSANLLRSLSGRSGRARNTSSIDHRESLDGLVPPERGRDDDESSVAATLDGQSLDGSDHHSLRSAEGGREIEISARLSESEAKQGHETPAQAALPKERKPQTESAPQPASPGVPLVQDAPRKDADESEAGNALASMTPSRIDVPEGSLLCPSEKAQSIASRASSVSLTKDRLPRSMSRVALSYRTNEWAKHLSYADAPEPDELHVAEPPRTPPRAKTKTAKEKPVPVNVKDLQQSPEDGIPPPQSDARMPSSSAEQNTQASKRVSNVVSSPKSPTMTTAPTEVPRSPMSPTQFSYFGMARPPSSVALGRPSSSFEPIAEEHDAAKNTGPIPEEQDDTRSISASLRSAGQGQRAVIPGVVSYASPQTLLGQREAFLRNKSQGNLLSPSPGSPAMPNRPPSDTSSIHNYSLYGSARGGDLDDIPLRQRKEMMRNSGLALPSPQRSPSSLEFAETTNFDSHQPHRNSSVPSQAVREARLAQFRSSVAMDLRAGSPLMTSGRETPFSGANTLLGNRDANIQRNIELQRNALLEQKEAEAHREAMRLRDKERANQEFSERMRTGQLVEAHREAMRRMQQGAK